MADPSTRLRTGRKFPVTREDPPLRIDWARAAVLGLAAIGAVTFTLAIAQLACAVAIWLAGLAGIQ